MELRHLRYFVTVAEELNFTRAAKRLQIAQPALSRQIHDLETEIGVRLFDRNSSRVFITDAGRRFLNEARVVLHHATQAIEAARQIKAGGVGTIRLGIGKGLGDVVSRIINDYLRRLPGVEIDVKDIASGFQNEAFVDRRIDVGFMRPPIEDLQLASEALFSERFSVVLRKASSLAKRRCLRLKDLAHETLLLIDRHISSGAYDKTLDLYRQAGVSPKIVPTETMPYEEAGAILVDSGKGIYLALGRNPCHPSFADRLVARPLCDPSATVPVHIVWRRDEQAKTVLDFVDFAQTRFNNARNLRVLKKGIDRLSPFVSETNKQAKPGIRVQRSHATE